MRVAFKLNGREVACDARENMTLLDLLRDELGVKSVKKGCQQGECGACTVLLGDATVNSCLVLAPQVDGKTVVTIDGLAEEPVMKALCQAFLEGGAIQCGFCTPGMLISAYALLVKNPLPTVEQVKSAIEGNLCRCTGYVNIIKAIQDTVEMIYDEAP